VKLLEAFAAGIPVVSTRVGAEGLAHEDGNWCALADDPGEFAAKVVALLNDEAVAAAMARRARAGVEADWDMAAVTHKLADGYRELVWSARQ
jgi:glycosyltransferase involved in cell wall biosynthesis